MVLSGGVLLAWLGGFFWYLADVSAQGKGAAPLPPSHPTAIVVLTGGSDRIAAGLTILQQGGGNKLFISGAGRGATFDRLFIGLPRVPALESCCIALGHEADDTIGNAQETLAWLQREQISRVILVTAHYHMRRSLLEFQLLASPDLIVVPYPVAPSRVQLAEWWQRPRTARLLMTEYTKLLFTLFRYEWQSLT